MIGMRFWLRVIAYSLLAALVLCMVAPRQLSAAGARPVPFDDAGFGVMKQDSPATPLTYDTNGDRDGSAYASGTLSPQGMEAYTIEVSEGIELSVRVTPDDGNLVLTVVGADGDPLLTDHAGASSFDQAVPVTQVYTLTVINFGQNAEDYEIAVDVGEQEADDDADEDITAAASGSETLPIDTNGDGNGDIRVNGALDPQGMASFGVEVNEGVNLDAQVTPDDGSLVLTVVGADGYPLLTDHAGASSFSAAVPATQVYTLTVINFGQSAQQYKLLVNIGSDYEEGDIDAAVADAQTPAAQGATQPILVPEGGVLVIPLQGNPTTGFTWQVSVSDEAIVQSRGDSLYIPSTDLVGGPGNEVFTFDALSAGDATLTFTYSQPWDTEAPPAQVLALPVAVSGEGELTAKSPTAEAPAPTTEPTQENAALTLKATDNGTQVQVPTGGVLSVDLGGNPTTGYIWQVASNDESVLLPLAYSFKPESDATGAGGVEHFEFLAIAPGNVALKFIHSRPWEKDAPPTDTFEAGVEVLNQAAPGAASILVSESEDGQRTAILQNNILAVQLAGPATGGAWQLVQGNAMILQPLGDWSVTPNADDATRATYTRNFLGVAGGKADIQFEFTPTDGTPATQSYSIGVDVIPSEPGSSAVVVATDADAGKDLKLVVGDALVLRVPANPSTGYDWRIVSTNDAYLTIEGDPQFASDSDLTGAGGVYTFRFLATAPGEATVQMGEYAPGADQPDQSLDYNLTIDTPAPLTGNTITAGEADAGNPIELKAGDLLKVSLEAIPSTGYHWEVTANDGSILRLQPESGFTPNSDLTGAPGTQDYIFRALIPGATTLKIGQFAPGATDAEKMLEYPVTVE